MMMNTVNNCTFVKEFILQAADKGSSAYGVVITDANGKLLSCAYGSLGIMESSFEAEIEAIAKGVSTVEKMRRTRVIFLSDCKEAVLAIKKKEILENRSGFMV